MITDEQVAQLIRGAGSAGPLPYPVDVDAVTTTARRARGRTQALTGLVVAAAIVAVTLAATSSSTTTTPATPNRGGKGDPGVEGSSIASLQACIYALVILFVLSLVARRTPAGSALRSAAAATWVVVAVSVVLVTMYWTAIIVAMVGELPSNAGGIVPWLVLATLAMLGMTVAALAARARLLRRRPWASVITTAWLFTGILAGTVLGLWLFERLLTELHQATIVDVSLRLGVLALAVMLGVATAYRLHVARAWIVGAAGTIALVLASLNALMWRTPDYLDAATSGIEDRRGILVGGLGLALIVVPTAAAWVALPGTRGRALTSVLVTTTLIVVVTAASVVRDFLWLSFPTDRPQPSLAGSFAWAAGLTVLAVVCLTLLDHRLQTTRRDDTD